MLDHFIYLWKKKLQVFIQKNKENSVNKIFRLGKSEILCFFVSRNIVRNKIDPETPQINFILLHEIYNFK